jgi:hypothetical protein
LNLYHHSYGNLKDDRAAPHHFVATEKEEQGFNLAEKQESNLAALKSLVVDDSFKTELCSQRAILCVVGTTPVLVRRYSISI